MKKRTLLVAMASLVTIAACIKEKKSVVPETGDNNNNDTPVVTQPVDTSKTDTPKVAGDSIVITGIDHIGLNAYGFKVLNLNVKCDSCDGDEIFLSVEGYKNTTIPQNIELSFSKASGYSDFNTMLVAKSYFANKDNIGISIIATNRKGKKTVYERSILVNPVTKSECNGYFMKACSNGYFSKLTHVSTGSAKVDTPINLNVRVYRNASEENLYLKDVLLGQLKNGFWYYSDKASQYHMLVNYNCNTRELNIPEQVVKGKGGSGTIYFTVSGSGKLNLDNKTFELTYVSIFVDAGSSVVQTYKLTGDLIQF